MYLSHYIILKQKGIAIPEDIQGLAISILLLRELDLKLQAALYALSIFPGMTDRKHWASILE